MPATVAAVRDLFSYRKYWAHRFGLAPFLPMSREEMDALGWDSCDVILVTGDAYVDHPSFGMAIVGRLLEAQGFRVGIIAQPDWHSARDFRSWATEPVLRRDRRQHGFDGEPLHLGSPHPQRRCLHAARRRRRAARSLRHRLFPALPRGVQGRADRDRRHRGLVAAHRALRLLVGESPPLGAARRQGRPPRLRQRRAADRRDRASDRGGQEDRGDRRPARHRVRAQGPARRLERDRLDDDRYAGAAEPAGRSVCDGAGAEAQRRRSQPRREAHGTVFRTCPGGRPRHGRRGRSPHGWVRRRPPGQVRKAGTVPTRAGEAVLRFHRRLPKPTDREHSVIRMPSYEQVADDPVLYAHASRILHQEANPGNARALVQRHGDTRRVAQPAADPADHEGNGRGVRAAVPARAASVLRRCEDSRRTR